MNDRFMTIPPKLSIINRLKKTTFYDKMMRHYAQWIRWRSMEICSVYPKPNPRYLTLCSNIKTNGMRTEIVNDVTGIDIKCMLAFVVLYELPSNMQHNIITWPLDQWCCNMKHYSSINIEKITMIANIQHWNLT